MSFASAKAPGFRDDPRAVDAMFRYLYPDEAVRADVIRFVNDDIKVVNEHNPEALSISFCPGDRDEIKLNVGQLWAAVLAPQSLLLLVTRSDLAACHLGDLSRPPVMIVHEDGGFATARDAAAVRIEGDAIPELRSKLMGSHRSFLAMAAASRSNRMRSHRPAVVAYVRDAAARA